MDESRKYFDTDSWIRLSGSGWGDFDLCLLCIKVFSDFFNRMPQINSKLNVVFSLLSCYHIHEAFTFLTVQITAASAVPNDDILIYLSKEISMLYSL